jgi:hypothetical protein
MRGKYQRSPTCAALNGTKSAAELNEVFSFDVVIVDLAEDGKAYAPAEFRQPLIETSSKVESSA